MTLEAQVQALLDLVEADRAAKCAALLGDARARAAALLRDAHAQARVRMRVAFAEERERRDARNGAARANLQTRQRVARQQLAAALLVAGWQRLPEALAARWRDSGSRGAWVARVVTSARAALSNGAWRIVHARDWPAAERDALVRDLATTQPVTPTFAADESIRAGLKIVADGNVVDGTLDGLLADRAEIGASLLQLLDEADRVSAAGPPQGANCSPSGGSAAATAASVGAHR